MSVGTILLSFLGFILLTLGTAVFVAAEFSLTALERSTVDANARSGGRRDKMVQRAHRTLSFQLSGAQIGISITTLITGYLAEPLIARLLAPVLASAGLPERWIDGGSTRPFSRRTSFENSASLSVLDLSSVIEAARNSSG